MQAIIFRLYGEYGHFKRPETNNNPCTYAYMHKVALVGLIGATLGVERDVMRNLYPQLCEDLLYAVKINSPIVKEPHAFTKRTTIDKHFSNPGRRYCEYLHKPDYTITLALKNDRSKEIFDKFLEYAKGDLSAYFTYFGVVNCPAYFEFLSEADVSEEFNGDFETDSILSAKHKIIDAGEIDLMFEWVPITSMPDESLFNTYGEPIQTICVQRGTVKANGSYRRLNEKTMWFM
jgi:CRISPR-associated protein Cas5 subtype I-B